jgi:hypothetical protein
MDTTTASLIGTDVDVYWNLHRKVWSVRDCKTRRVVGHAKNIVLTDVTFRVSAAGNARVRAEGRKNVHAFARGTVSSFGGILPHDDSVSVTYNPYKYTTFVEEVTKRPVHRASIAWLGPRTVFALDTTTQSGKMTA